MRISRERLDYIVSYLHRLDNALYVLEQLEPQDDRKIRKVLKGDDNNE